MLCNYFEISSPWYAGDKLQFYDYLRSGYDPAHVSGVPNTAGVVIICRGTDDTSNWEMDYSFNSGSDRGSHSYVLGFANIYSDNVGHASNTHYGFGTDGEWEEHWTSYTIDYVWNMAFYDETWHYKGTFDKLKMYELFANRGWDLGAIEQRYDTKEPVTYIHARSTDDMSPWWINYNGGAGPNVGDGTYSWGFA